MADDSLGLPTGAFSISAMANKNDEVCPQWRSRSNSTTLRELGMSMTRRSTRPSSYTSNPQRPVLLRYIPMLTLSRSQSRFITEGMGTFFFTAAYSLSLMNCGVLSLNGKDHTRNLAPLSSGCMLIALVLCFGDISGAHFNPAITLAAVLSSAIHVEEAISYWLAQCVGGIVGGLCGVLLNGATRHLPAPQVYRSGLSFIMVAFASEALFSMILATLVLHTMFSKQRNVELYALTVGFTEIFSQYSVGAISGGAFNPAVALGLQLSKFIAAGYVAPLMQQWLYWAAPAVGAVAASLIFQMTHPAPPAGEEDLEVGEMIGRGGRGGGGERTTMDSMAREDSPAAAASPHKASEYFSKNVAE